MLNQNYFKGKKMNLKLPSHDNNAEESLLISLLSDNQNYYDLEALEPDDF